MQCASSASQGASFGRRWQTFINLETGRESTMIKKIVSLPWKAVKGTYKAASWAYKAAAAVLLGAAVYKGVQKVRDDRKEHSFEEMPPIPAPPVKAAPAKKPARKRKKAKRAKKA